MSKVDLLYRELVSEIRKDTAREIKQKLQSSKLAELLRIGFPRAVGHTHAEIHGVANVPEALFLVSDEAHRSCLKLPREKVITLGEIPKTLFGRSAPLVVDHLALDVLWYEVIQILLDYEK